MVDFMSGVRSQQARKPALQQVNFEGMIQAQQAANKRRETDEARRRRINAAGGVAAYHLGVNNPQSGPSAEEESKGIFASAFGGVHDLMMGNSTLGKLIAPVNPVAIANQTSKLIPGDGREKVANAGLTAIDASRRAAILTLEEKAKNTPDWMKGVEAAYNPVQGAMNFLVDPDDESEQSNWEKLGDETYGFGDIARQVSTGNEGVDKWANRGIGLVGDVAFDPASYLTLGTTKFTGAGGRAAAWNTLNNANNRALAQGLDAVATPQQMDRIATHGVTTADDAMKRVLDFKGGIQLGGAKIPGTDRAGRFVGNALSDARVAAGETRLGRIGSQLRSPSELKSQLDIVAGRKPGDVNAAMSFITSIDTKRATGGMVAAQFRLPELAKGLRKAGKSGRQGVTHAAESGTDLSNPLVAATRKFFDDVADLSEAAGMTGQARIENYVKHYITKSGSRALGAVEAVGANTKHLTNMAQSKGGAFAREFKPGKSYAVTLPETGEKVLVKLETATIQEVNEKIGGLLGVKILEDDIGTIITRAIRDASEDIGTAAMLKKMEKTHPDLVASYRTLMDDEATPIDRVRQLQKAGLAPDGSDATKKQRRNAQDRAARAVKVVDQGWSNDMTSDFVKAAKRGQIGPRIQQMLDEGFEIIETQMRQTGAVGDELIMHPQVKEAFRNVAAQVRDPKFADVLAGYLDFTRLFKAYATMTPGFHLRNGMSAMFMNFSDGVTVRDHKEAFDMMKRLRQQGPDEFFDNLTPRQKLAFEAAVGSGMAGSVSATETRMAQDGRGGIDWLAEHGGGAGRGVAAVAGRLEENFATRLHRSFGQMGVEGPVRLAAALNTINRSGLSDAELFGKFAANVIDLDALKVGKTVDVAPSDLNHPKLWHDDRSGGRSVGMNAKGMERMVPGHRLGPGAGASGDEFLDELAHSMATQGQQTPITVRKQPDGTWWISEGNNRVAAANRAGMPSVRVKRGPDLTDQARGVGVQGTTADSVLGGFGDKAAAAQVGTRADDLLNEAIHRVTRLHFDYSQSSNVDQLAKTVIPFWTFMSRNLPLQLQQQFMRPKAYQGYAAIKRNLDIGGEDDPMPAWMQDAGAFKAVNGTFGQEGDEGLAFMPDLPFTRLGETAETLTTLDGLLGSANPLIKMGVETQLNHKSFTGGEFHPDDNKWLYAMKGLIPPLARVESLFGGQIEQAIRNAGDHTAAQQARIDRSNEYTRGGIRNAWLGLFGSPVKIIDEGVAEQGRRHAANDAAAEAALEKIRAELGRG